MRYSTRQNALAYLQAQSLPFVGTIFPARPWLIEEGDYDQGVVNWLENNGLLNGQGDTMSSAVVVINLPTSVRRRETITGRTAVDDSDKHDVVLEVFFANQSGDNVQAQLDHDQLMDALVLAVRKDPTLGTTGQASNILAAGEQDAGVLVEQREPFNDADGATLYIPAEVRFEALEWISGSGV